MQDVDDPLDAASHEKLLEWTGLSINDLIFDELVIMLLALVATRDEKCLVCCIMLLEE